MEQKHGCDLEWYRACGDGCDPMVDNGQADAAALIGATLIGGVLLCAISFVALWVAACIVEILPCV